MEESKDLNSSSTLDKKQIIDENCNIREDSSKMIDSDVTVREIESKHGLVVCETQPSSESSNNEVKSIHINQIEDENSYTTMSKTGFVEDNKEINCDSSTSDIESDTGSLHSYSSFINTTDEDMNETVIEAKPAIIELASVDNAPKVGQKLTKDSHFIDTSLLSDGDVNNSTIIEKKSDSTNSGFAKKYSIVTGKRKRRLSDAISPIRFMNSCEKKKSIFDRALETPIISSKFKASEDTTNIASSTPISITKQEKGCARKSIMNNLFTETLKEDYQEQINIDNNISGIDMSLFTRETIFEEDSCQENTALQKTTTQRFKDIKVNLSTIDVENEKFEEITEDILGLEEMIQVDNENQIDTDVDLTLVAVDDIDNKELDEDKALAQEPDVVHKKDPTHIVIKKESSELGNKTIADKLDTDDKNRNISEKVHVIKNTEVKDERLVVNNKKCKSEKDKEKSKQNTNYEQMIKFKTENESVTSEKRVKDKSEAAVIEINIEIMEEKNKDNKSAEKKSTWLTAAQNLKVEVFDNKRNVCNSKELEKQSSLDASKKKLEDSNDLMTVVRKRWNSHGIPDPEENLTTATSLHSKNIKVGKDQGMGVLEGQKLCCLNLYEDDLDIKSKKKSKKQRRKANEGTSDTLAKLYQQVKGIEDGSRISLQRIRSDASNRKRQLLRKQHNKVMDLKHRQNKEVRLLRFRNYLPFVIQQKTMQLKAEHSAQLRHLQNWHQQEFETLQEQLQLSLQTEIDECDRKVNSVNELMSHLKSINRTEATSEGKHGPMVVVSLKKAPCKDTMWKKSTVSVCLPAEVAQQLLLEEQVFDHFYRY